MIIFINRESELEFLERRYKEDGFQLLILYGRRRVGKTELISRFMGGKPHIYYLAPKTTPADQLEKFYDVASAELGEDIKDLKMDWEIIFRSISQRAGRLIVIIDEFPYLTESDKAITSIFQRIVDLHLKNSNIMLILCGSSIGMMETEVLGYKSPLYGCRSGQWRVEPLKFLDFASYFKNYSIYQKIETFAVTGGIPFYFIKFYDRLSVIENIKRRILAKGEILNEEVEILMREELRKPRTYFTILKALALGNAKFGNIMAFTELEKNTLTSYLNILESLYIIKREIPITDSPRSKKGIYRIRDNFFRFWFKFAFPYQSELESGNIEHVLGIIKRDFNSFTGEAFEDIAVEFLQELHRKRAIPFSFNKHGKWWHKGEEIDTVTLNEETKEIAFLECKWSKVNEKEAEKILADLKRKAMLVKWHNSKRRERYGIIAKKIEGKEKLRSSGVLAFDLQDFETVPNKV